MELSKVVPWGRSLNEYSKMFSLSEDDLKKKILGWKKSGVTPFGYKFINY